jgi:hypothetical protein
VAALVMPALIAPSQGQIICNGATLPAPSGMHIRTYLDPRVPVFTGQPRKLPVTEITLHETVTRDVKTAQRVLARRRLGVHFIVGPYGDITQHADPALVRLEHAAPHNGRSVGIEVVNPVEARFLRDHLPWEEIIQVPWLRGGYVLPTRAQAEATAQLVAWLTSESAPGLRIPRHWTGLRGGRMTMGRVPGSAKPRPGVWAHAAFRHQDGAWPLLYTILRLENGLSARRAYDVAVRLGKSSEPDLSKAEEPQASVAR